MRLLVCVLTAALLLSSCADENGPPAAAVIMLSDAFSSEFDLIDDTGEPFATRDIGERAAVVYFGFTSCANACPPALGKMAAALNLLSEKELADVRALFISFDPARDTPETLNTYLSPFEGKIKGLTGAPEKVDAAKKSFRVFAERVEEPESALQYSFEHTSLFYLIDPDGEMRMALHDTVTPEQLASAVRRRLKS